MKSARKVLPLLSSVIVGLDPTIHTVISPPGTRVRPPPPVPRRARRTSDRAAPSRNGSSDHGCAGPTMTAGGVIHACRTITAGRFPLTPFNIFVPANANFKICPIVIMSFAGRRRFCQNKPLRPGGAEGRYWQARCRAIWPPDCWLFTCLTRQRILQRSRSRRHRHRRPRILLQSNPSRPRLPHPY
jgi:hypothetical protein